MIAKPEQKAALAAALVGMLLLATPAFGGTPIRDIEAADRALAAGDLTPSARAELLLRRAESWRRLGYLPRAADGFRDALDAAAAAGDTVLAGRALVGRGLLRVRLGEFAEAEADLRRAGAIATAAGDEASAATAQAGLGALFGASKRHDLAETALVAAAAAAEQAGDLTTAAETAVNRGRVALSAGRKADAGRRLQEAGRLLAAAPENDRTVMARIGLARLETQADPVGGRVKAHRLLAAAAAAAQRLDDSRALSYAWGYMGELYERAGQLNDAAAATDRAQAAAIKADAPESAYRWHWQAARLAVARGALEEASTMYERAAAALDDARGELAANPLSGADSFHNEVEPLYLGYADLLLRLADRAPGGGGGEAGQRWLYRARATMERLKAAELEDYFKDDCVAELDTRKRTIDKLAPGTAAIYPILLPDRTELLVSIGDRLERVRAPVGRAELTRTTGELRALLEKRATHQYREPARKLYEWLITPLSPLLQAANIDTLVLAPDGPLRTIPLAALHDGERFLIERYAVAVSPGLTLIDPKPIAATNGRALLAGLSRSAQGFAALPQVERELDALSGLLRAEDLRNEDFSQSALTRELRRASYNIVHIASHGEFRGDHAGSFLLTYDGKISLERLEGLVALSRFRARPVELLVLSACQTAAGDERAALGLAGVALKAGARSAVATLWLVDDEASSELMQAFYRHLRGGASKAQALRHAQADVAASSRHRHPYYWAAYMVIGNWL